MKKKKLIITIDNYVCVRIEMRTVKVKPKKKHKQFAVSNKSEDG